MCCVLSSKMSKSEQKTLLFHTKSTIFKNKIDLIAIFKLLKPVPTARLTLLNFYVYFLNGKIMALKVECCKCLKFSDDFGLRQLVILTNHILYKIYLICYMWNESIET